MRFALLQVNRLRHLQKPLVHTTSGRVISTTPDHFSVAAPAITENDHGLVFSFVRRRSYMIESPMLHSIVHDSQLHCVQVDLAGTRLQALEENLATRESQSSGISAGMVWFEPFEYSELTYAGPSLIWVDSASIESLEDGTVVKVSGLPDFSWKVSDSEHRLLETVGDIDHKLQDGDALPAGWISPAVEDKSKIVIDHEAKEREIALQKRVEELQSVITSQELVLQEKLSAQRAIEDAARQKLKQEHESTVGELYAAQERQAAIVEKLMAEEERARQQAEALDTAEVQAAAEEERQAVTKNLAGIAAKNQLLDEVNPERAVRIQSAFRGLKARNSAKDLNKAEIKKGGAAAIFRGAPSEYSNLDADETMRRAMVSQLKRRTNQVEELEHELVNRETVHMQAKIEADKLRSSLDEKEALHQAQLEAQLLATSQIDDLAREIAQIHTDQQTQAKDLESALAEKELLVRAQVEAEQAKHLVSALSEKEVSVRAQIEAEQRAEAERRAVAEKLAEVAVQMELEAFKAQLLEKVNPESAVRIQSAFRGLKSRGSTKDLNKAEIEKGGAAAIFNGPPSEYSNLDADETMRRATLSRLKRQTNQVEELEHELVNREAVHMQAKTEADKLRSSLDEKEALHLATYAQLTTRTSQIDDLEREIAQIHTDQQTKAKDLETARAEKELLVRAQVEAEQAKHLVSALSEKEVSVRAQIEAEQRAEAERRAVAEKLAEVAVQMELEAFKAQLLEKVNPESAVRIQSAFRGLKSRGSTKDLNKAEIEKGGAAAIFRGAPSEYSNLDADETMRRATVSQLKRRTNQVEELEQEIAELIAAQQTQAQDFETALKEKEQALAEKEMRIRAEIEAELQAEANAAEEAKAAEVFKATEEAEAADETRPARSDSADSSSSEIFYDAEAAPAAEEVRIRPRVELVSLRKQLRQIPHASGPENKKKRKKLNAKIKKLEAVVALSAVPTVLSAVSAFGRLGGGDLKASEPTATKTALTESTEPAASTKSEQALPGPDSLVLRRTEAGAALLGLDGQRRVQMTRSFTRLRETINTPGPRNTETKTAAGESPAEVSELPEAEAVETRAVRVQSACTIDFRCVHLHYVRTAGQPAAKRYEALQAVYRQPMLTELVANAMQAAHLQYTWTASRFNALQAVYRQPTVGSDASVAVGPLAEEFAGGVMKSSPEPEVETVQRLLAEPVRWSSQHRRNSAVMVDFVRISTAEASTPTEKYWALAAVYGVKDPKCMGLSRSPAASPMSTPNRRSTTDSAEVVAKPQLPVDRIFCGPPSENSDLDADETMRRATLSRLKRQTNQVEELEQEIASLHTAQEEQAKSLEVAIRKAVAEKEKRVRAEIEAELHTEANAAEEAKAVAAAKAAEAAEAVEAARAAETSDAAEEAEATDELKIRPQVELISLRKQLRKIPHGSGPENKKKRKKLNARIKKLEAAIALSAMPTALSAISAFSAMKKASVLNVAGTSPQAATADVDSAESDETLRRARALLEHELVGIEAGHKAKTEAATVEAEKLRSTVTLMERAIRSRLQGLCGSKSLQDVEEGLEEAVAFGDSMAAEEVALRAHRAQLIETAIELMTGLASGDDLAAMKAALLAHEQCAAAGKSPDRNSIRQKIASEVLSVRYNQKLVSTREFLAGLCDSEDVQECNKALHNFHGYGELTEVHDALKEHRDSIVQELELDAFLGGIESDTDLVEMKQRLQVRRQSTPSTFPYH